MEPNVIIWSDALQSVMTFAEATNQALKTYQVVFKDKPCLYILARDSERAAWQALELSLDKDAQLIDVRLFRDEEW